MKFPNASVSALLLVPLAICACSDSLDYDADTGQAESDSQLLRSVSRELGVHIAPKFNQNVRHDEPFYAFWQANDTNFSGVGNIDLIYAGRAAQVSVGVVRGQGGHTISDCADGNNDGIAEVCELAWSQRTSIAATGQGFLQNISSAAAFVVYSQQHSGLTRWSSDELRIAQNVVENIGTGSATQAEIGLVAAMATARTLFVAEGKERDLEQYVKIILKFLGKAICSNTEVIADAACRAWASDQPIGIGRDGIDYNTCYAIMNQALKNECRRKGVRAQADKGAFCEAGARAIDRECPDFLKSNAPTSTCDNLSNEYYTNCLRIADLVDEDQQETCNDDELYTQTYDSIESEVEYGTMHKYRYGGGTSEDHFQDIVNDAVLDCLDR